MQNLRQFASAFLLAFFSVVFVLGGLFLSLAEMDNHTAQQTKTLFSTPLPLTATPPLPPDADLYKSTNTAVSTDTLQSPPSCPVPPSSWIPVYVQPGDTLSMIAQRHNTTPEQLRVANCLLTNALIPGSRLFVPPAPVSTPVRCGPPPGWIKGFTVHRGDTLFSISQSYGISLASLKLANCKDDRNLIFDGEVLWVPNITTRTPTMTSSSVPDYVTVYPTDPLTETSLPFTATIIPSNTPVPATNTVPATHDDS